MLCRVALVSALEQPEALPILNSRGLDIGSAPAN
jgi:hypothetical protein